MNFWKPESEFTGVRIYYNISIMMNRGKCRVLFLIFYVNSVYDYGTRCDNLESIM